MISGEGVQTVGDGPAFPIREGDAVYIPKDTAALDLQHDVAPAAARRSCTRPAAPRPDSTACPTRASSTPERPRAGSQDR